MILYKKQQAAYQQNKARWEEQERAVTRSAEAALYKIIQFPGGYLCDDESTETEVPSIEEIGYFPWHFCSPSRTDQHTHTEFLSLSPHLPLFVVYLQ